MLLTGVRIQNFRGIRDLELSLGEMTVLVGENNSGKTAILDALRLCLRELGPRRRVVFEAYDFHLKDSQSEPMTAEKVAVELTFSERTGGDWEDVKVRRLRSILHVNDAGLNAIKFRVTCAYDPVSADFEQTWDFLDAQGSALPGKTEASLAILQREVTYFLLAALRDAARHFDPKGPFWRPFLRDSRLPADKKAEIETKLKEVNDLVVASHASFDRAKTRLNDVQDVVPMTTGDLVSIEAVPGRMFDMLSRAQVHLGTPTGAKVPVGRHGEGTQSLAVLMLFSAFLEAWPSGDPLVALEEPEAHLHPSAVRALWRVLLGINGQKLVSTHSGDLLSEVDVHMIRRIVRSQGQVRCFQIPASLLDNEEKRKLTYHVRRTRGELFFARCWLLVEGETEAWIYPAAARAKDIDLHREGVRIVEYSQSDVGLLAKVANALGIPWYCVVDDDSGRMKFEGVVRANLGTAPEADRLGLPYVNAEVHLLSNGYSSVYAPLMPAQNLARVTKTQGDVGYWEEYAYHLPSKAKTRGAAAAASAIEARGASGVTPELDAVLSKVRLLAERS